MKGAKRARGTYPCPHNKGKPKPIQSWTDKESGQKMDRGGWKKKKQVQRGESTGSDGTCRDTSGTYRSSFEGMKKITKERNCENIR